MILFTGLHSNKMVFYYWLCLNGRDAKEPIKCCGRVPLCGDRAGTREQSINFSSSCRDRIWTVIDGGNPGEADNPLVGANVRINEDK